VSSSCQLCKCILNDLEIYMVEGGGIIVNLINLNFSCGFVFNVGISRVEMNLDLKDTLLTIRKFLDQICTRLQ